METEKKILYELIIDDHKTIGNESFHSFSKAALYQLSFKLFGDDVEWDIKKVAEALNDTEEEVEGTGLIRGREKIWIHSSEYIETVDDITDEYIKKIQTDKYWMDKNENI